MSDVLRLSQEVQTFIDSWPHDFDLSVEEREETEQIRRVVRATVDDIIASREMVTEGKFAPFEKMLAETPNLIDELLDERFTRDVISAVPGYVRRTMEFSRLTSYDIPSKVTNSYLREAGRTYILGLPQACVALCRAAMEQAVKENLGYQGTETFVNMEQLLDEAEGGHVIDTFMRKIARQIADDADDVLHEKPTDSIKAFTTLLALRGLLQHIYR